MPKNTFNKYVIKNIFMTYLLKMFLYTLKIMQQKIRRKPRARAVTKLKNKDACISFMHNTKQILSK
jgi:K+-transporting ATPase A subunit